MKLANVWIEGVTPLLQNRFSESAEGNLRSATRPVNVCARTPREIAEEAAYRSPDGTLFFPGAAIGRLLREAGASHKQRGSRRSVKAVVPAAALVLDDAVPLFDPDRERRLRDFEVDARPVTIPATRGRVMRYRPRHDRWSARFTIRVNDEVLDLAVIRQLLVEGGTRIGIGDYRPERGGPFGTFAVVSWDERVADHDATQNFTSAA